MTLSLYVFRRFLKTFLIVFMVFWSIILLIDLVEQLRRFSADDISTTKAFHLALMNSPASLYRILPLIMILSAIALFLALARSSELVVIRAAGRSGLRFLVTPLLAALAIGLVAVGILNPLVAATQKEYDRLWTVMSRGEESTLSFSETGLWLRQGTETGQTVIHAQRANTDGTELFQVSFVLFDESGLPSARIEAGSAQLEPGAWRLQSARRWDLTAANPERSVTVLDDGTELASNLTREGILDSFGDPSVVPFWDLPDYIKGLENAGFSARSHRVWLQIEMAQPMLLAAMVLVAAGFTMRHTRAGGTGTLVLIAVLCGFAIFFLRNFAQVLGQNGQVPIALAAWTPPIAAILLALSLLLHLEDG